MERSEIIEKANKDLADFLAQLKPKKYEDGWPEDCWEEEMEKHPLFMSKEVEEGQDLPPLVEALQQLKYDPDMNTPEELAESYKEDGNVNFKRKKFRWAVHSYSQGIEVNSENKELNAQLYANRATAQYHIGNYRKSLADAIEAKNLKPDYIKALQRGAMCCLELKEFLDCVSWCEDGLKLEPENKCFIDLKKKAEEEKKMFDRNKRKALVQEAKKKKEMELVLNAIKERGITLVNNKLELDEVESMHPAFANAKVHLNGDQLVWPVIFMYSEYGTTDYIQEFNEDTSFMDHLNAMFNGDDLPAWDKNHEYLPENLQVYFTDNACVIPFNKRKTLKKALSHSRYRVHGGTPCFIITVQNSEFDRSFREKNGCSTK